MSKWSWWLTSHTARRGWREPARQGWIGTITAVATRSITPDTASLRNVGTTLEMISGAVLPIRPPLRRCGAMRAAGWPEGAQASGLCCMVMRGRRPWPSIVGSMPPGRCAILRTAGAPFLVGTLSPLFTVHRGDVAGLISVTPSPTGKPDSSDPEPWRLRRTHMKRVHPVGPPGARPGVGQPLVAALSLSDRWIRRIVVLIVSLSGWGGFDAPDALRGMAHDRRLLEEHELVIHRAISDCTPTAFGRGRWCLGLPDDRLMPLHGEELLELRSLAVVPVSHHFFDRFARVERGLSSPSTGSSPWPPPLIAAVLLFVTRKRCGLESAAF